MKKETEKALLRALFRAFALAFDEARWHDMEKLMSQYKGRKKHECRNYKDMLLSVAADTLKEYGVSFVELEDNTFNSLTEILRSHRPNKSEDPDN